MRDRSHYLPHVDGLRAIAIALVVGYHAWPASLPGGFVGVDVFLVVSGFLITRLMLAEMQAGTFSLLTFFARRARRLLPAMVVVLATLLAVGWFIMLPETYRDLGRGVVATVLMHANVLFYQTAGYFSVPIEEKPLLHAWSLSVEDQFYLTWPILLMLLAPRVSRATLVAITAALLVVSLVHAELRLASDPDYAFYWLAPRGWELLAGCLLALLARQLAVGRAASSLLGVAGFALVLASAFVLGENSGLSFPGLAAVPVVAGTAMIVAAGLTYDEVGGFVRWLAWRPLVLLGLVSYSLYLWHWPLLSLGQYVAGRALAPSETAGLVAASLLLAVLSFRYVERPFRRHGPMPLRPTMRTLLASTLAIAVLAIAGGSLRALDGLPARFDGAIGKLFDELAHGNPLRPFCDGHDLAFANEEHCNFGRRRSPGESYEMAVFGDSNADHLVGFVTRWAESVGLSGRQVTQSDCPPLLGVAIPERGERADDICERYQQTIVDFVAANPRLKLVVLSAAWTRYAVPGKLAQNDLAWPGQPARAGSSIEFQTALEDTASFFRRRGIHVHLIGQVPHFEKSPARCTVAALGAGRSPETCGIPSEKVQAEHAQSERAMRAAAASGPAITFTLMRELTCAGAWCLPMKDGVYLYRDATHLNSTGSRHLAGYVAMPSLASVRSPSEATPR